MAKLKTLERLDKVLSNSGFGSRKGARLFISRGLVLVNGEPVRALDAKVNPEVDEISVDGKPLVFKVHSYFMMNKKAGSVCSSRSENYETVFSFLSPEDRQKKIGGELGIVGRLDADTEGLLILTTDGALNHQLTSPKHGVEKTYEVVLRDSVGENLQSRYSERLAEGIHIEADGRAPEADCRGARIEWLSENSCRLSITEGKYHEVKRIFHALENEVVRLRRVRMGALALDESLPPGGYRELSGEEVELLGRGNSGGEND